MKAQVSLELLVVMLIFLGMLALWLAGTSQVRDSTEKTLDAYAMKLAADRLAGAVNSVCLMGSGNSRTLKVFFPDNTTVSFDKSLIVGSMERHTYCQVDTGFDVSGSCSIIAENHGGTVTLQQLESLSDIQGLE